MWFIISISNTTDLFISKEFIMVVWSFNARKFYCKFRYNKVTLLNSVIDFVGDSMGKCCGLF
jgi:hypothetical protein